MATTQPKQIGLLLLGLFWSITLCYASPPPAPLGTASIGNFVWLDSNKNGQQDASEVGVSGIVVTLYNNTGAIVGVTRTDAAGKYNFNQLNAGTYTLLFSLPSSYVFTGKDSLGSTDVIDSDIYSTGENFGKTDPITLIAGATNNDVDAGIFYATPTRAVVGDFVWYDTNNNGLQDAAEKGISDITVVLYDGTNKKIATTITDGNGKYHFVVTAAGSYRVLFKLPIGYIFATRNAAGYTPETGSDAYNSGANFAKTDLFTVNMGDSIAIWDAALVRTPVTRTSVGNLVWNDINVDGIRDAGEPGIPDVLVTLKNSANVTITTTLTDELGYYMFTNVGAGSYYITYSLPSGYLFTLDDQGDGSNDSDVPVATGKTELFALKAGDYRTDVDAGMYQSSPLGNISLGDRVWNDMNKNGIQDATELGIAGVTVTLYDNTRTYIDQVVTDKNGNYLFVNVAPGLHCVGFSNLPDGYSFTTPNQGGVPSDDSDVQADGKSPMVNYTSGTVDMDIDAGLVLGRTSIGKGVLGNSVWNDLNGNGIQEATEPFMPEIRVILYAEDGITPLDTTYTNGKGEYLFRNLPAKPYYVQFANLPAGFSFTTQNQGSDDNIDSDVNVAGRTGLVSVGSEENIFNVDAGVRNITNTASIGDFVWNDTNNNGVQNAGEPGVPGIMVTLLDNLGNEIKQVMTNEKGFYSFSNLLAGTYSIVFGNVPSGLTFGLQGAGGNAALDSDANPATGKTANITIVAGQTQKDIDAALVNAKASIGNFVWYDQNRNGKQDVGEPGIEGVEVTLYDNTSNPISKAITDEKGQYYFINIPAPASYQLGFAKYPTEMAITAKDTTVSGTTDANDSDVDKITHKTSLFAVIAGSTNYDIDAGFITSKVGSVQGYVWRDMDRDGVQNSQEKPFASVTVTLYASNGTTVLGTTVTGADGLYTFDNLPVGDYIFGFSTLPANYVFTLVGQGGDPMYDSDVDVITGKSPIYTILEGRRVEGADAGLSPTRGTIGNLVWLDTNQDGSQDPEEPGVSAVTLTLYNSAGGIVAVTKTDAYGYYLFNEVLSGSYQVAISLPIDYVISTYNGGGADRDNDFDPATGMTALFALSSSADSTTIDAGIYFKDNIPSSIGNYVFLDGDGNGIQGATEKGFAGVVVTLYDNAAKPLLSTISDETGYYLFNNIPAGTYSIGATLPISYQFASQDMGGNDNLDSDINPVTGRTINFSVGTSDQRLIWDIGIRKTGSLRGTVGNTVWNDLDHDGVQDVGELGVQGVKVDLYDGRLGTLVYSTITDAFGTYLFNNLVSNVYWLQLTLPSGWAASPLDQGTDDEVDSDIDATGKTIRFGITDGDRFLDIDAGIYQVSTAGNALISNRVWVDANMNGLQDAGENGIGGVSVILLNNALAPIDSVTTNETGYYRFGSLAAGNYYVKFFNIPLGMNFTTKDADGLTTNYLDSDVNIATGITDMITLSGSTRDTTTDAGLISLTQNAGFGSVGNMIWYDRNGNGQQETNEGGVAGVTVTLTNIGTGISTTTKTDGSGYYIFNGLNFGSYRIAVTLPATYTFAPQDAASDNIDSDVNTTTGQSGIFMLAAGESNVSIDAGMYVNLTSATIGNFVWNDTDMDGTQDGSEKGVPGITVTLYSASLVALQVTATDNRGYYAFSGVGAGTYTVGFSNLPYDYTFSPKNRSGNDLTDSDVSPNTGITGSFAVLAGATKIDIDAGIYATNTAALGNFVWFDTNNNGMQDGAEKGAAGVTVKLYDGGGNEIVSTVADDAGNYYFPNLFPGDYITGFVSIPTGARFTLVNMANDSIDNDANTLGLVDTLTVNPAQVNMDIDGGIGSPVPSSLYGYAWGDYQSFNTTNNRNGIQDAGEKAISGVTVTLYNAGNNVLLATAVTDEKGRYVFNNIPPATYFLRFSGFPLNSRLTLKNQGANDAIDSDVDTVFLNAGPYTVALGEAKEGADIGFIPGATIRGITFKDGVPNQANTADGFRNNQNPSNPMSPIDPEMGDVTVLLLNALTNPPSVMRTSYSVENGTYVFRNLDPNGKYFIAFEGYPQYCNTCDFTVYNANANVNDSTDSDIDPNKFIFTSGKNYMYSDTIKALAPLANMRTLYAGYKQPGSAFPIELLSLTAEWRDIDGLLKWTTTKEVNSDNFGIERSLDEGFTFQLIGSVDAAGQSDVNNSYQYLDAGIGNFSQDKIYYRLKMIDIDGTFKYSDKVELRKGDGLKSIYMDAYPNPTDKILNVDFHIEDDANVELRLFNPMGQVLFTRLLKASKEPQSTQVDVSDYPQGNYYLQMNTNSTSIIRHIIVK